MYLPFKKKQRTQVILLILLCAGIAVSTIYLYRQLQAANWWVGHTLTVMQESEEALVCLMDCETAYRGFLITGKDEFLEPYDKCFNGVDKHIDQVASLTRDNSTQQALMPELRQLAADKVRFSQQVIAAARQAQDNGTPAKLAIDLAPGKVMMDKFRALTERVQKEERRLLVQRQDRAKSLSEAALISILVLCASVVGAVAWLASTARRFAIAETEAMQTVSKARDEAIRSNLLKSQLVANVSHEIRTPLSGMLGICELLANSDTTSDTKELSSLVLESGKNLMNLINDLLDFSKLESGKFTLLEEEFSVEMLVHEVNAVMRPLADKRNLQLNADTELTLTKNLIGDSYRIRQVLLNLVNNAIKFTKQGQITVRASLASQTTQIAEVHFEVQDTGIGISDKQIKQLFEPYVQADGSQTTKTYGGTGLGLSISKKLVELMHGSMGCRSDVGAGSVFWFNIPLKRLEVLDNAKPTDSIV